MSASLVGSEMCIRDSSRASGGKFEAVSGSVQFKLRTPEAILHFRKGLRLSRNDSGHFLR
eukprot:3336740-Alexandrium_andersonii.AAC.1